MDEYRPTVLIVDDEELVTITLRNLFLLRTDYSVIVHTSASAALADAGSRAIDLVITDYLMPEMDGISFLSRFKEIQPQTVRVLLTGYADKANAIRAINTVGLYQYIEKPWDNDDLLLTIRNGLERQHLMKRLNEKIEQINRAYGELQGLQKAIVKTFI